MKRNIALFASGTVGFQVAEYLANSEDDVKILFVAGENPALDLKIRNLAEVAGIKVYEGDLRSNLEDFVSVLTSNQIDTIITVYWPFLLPGEVIRCAELTVNFHPALLPMNRGWYPHVHNIISGTEPGVTLHKLSEEADEGDIWAQAKVVVYPWDCAGDLYVRLQESITRLFFEYWPHIRMNEIEAQSQKGLSSSYNSKKTINELDEIILEKEYSGAEIINLLRARTFGDNGFAFFRSENHKIRIRVILQKED